MPNYTNSFSTPEFIEEDILDQKQNKIGTVRIKPSTVLWKPKGEQRFYAVPLATFANWIADPSTKAKRVKH